jgi:glycosyltransferase involved in cell wall biosynthesis
MLSYALITPARNEAENLRRLGECVVAQRHLPVHWIVVDDGSTDETAAVAQTFAARGFEWIRVITSPGAEQKQGPLAAGRRAGRDVVAFNAGVAAIDELPDLLVKLDADVSFEPDYFEALVSRFAAEPRLGIAGGLCLEQDSTGTWLPQHVTGNHVRGATRVYRRECLEDVSPLEVRLGWDGIDELTAQVKGWRTATLADVPFRHHRPVGQRDGTWSSWASRGDTAYYMRYRPTYLVARSVFHSRRDIHALAMIWGFAEAAIRREPRHDDDTVAAYLRRQQSLRRMRSAFRAAAGRGRA